MSGVPPVDEVLAQAARTPRPVYLLIGEPFQTERTARALIEVLVPAERRTFNLEQYDGRTTAIGVVLDSLRMRGLFPGTKVVWVREPTLFLSGEKRGEIVDALFAAWADDRAAEAADKLLTLAALAGWTQERFQAVEWAALPATEATALFGRAVTVAERTALDAIRAACAERRLTVGEYRDDSGLLVEWLAGDPPATSVLLFTAAAVDRRKRVVKAVAEAGAVVELALARERSGALAAESIDRLVAQVLDERRKRLTPPAQRLVAQRAGGDPGMLAAELEKLCLYVGEAASIGEDDVRACMRDLSESWVFDFTKALAQRQAGPAVTLLRALFAQGEPPLRLVALIARELRLLLLARDCLTETLAGQWKGNLRYDEFQRRLLPMLSAPQREAFGGLHPYVLFVCLQNAARASTAALQRGVLQLQAVDLRLKSSGADPRMALEAFVLDLCRAPDRAPAR